jgi:hypothetical protein
MYSHTERYSPYLAYLTVSPPSSQQDIYSHTESLSPWPGRRPRHSKGELKNNSRKPRDLTKHRHSDRLKKNQLTLSQGVMQKGDIIVIADNVDMMR